MKYSVLSVLILLNTFCTSIQLNKIDYHNYLYLNHLSRKLASMLDSKIEYDENFINRFVIFYDFAVLSNNTMSNIYKYHYNTLQDQNHFYEELFMIESDGFYTKIKHNTRSEVLSEEAKISAFVNQDTAVIINRFYPKRFSPTSIKYSLDNTLKLPNQNEYEIYRVQNTGFSRVSNQNYKVNFTKSLNYYMISKDSIKAILKGNLVKGNYILTVFLDNKEVYICSFQNHLADSITFKNNFETETAKITVINDSVFSIKGNNRMYTGWRYGPKSKLPYLYNQKDNYLMIEYYSNCQTIHKNLDNNISNYSIVQPF